MKTLRIETSLRVTQRVEEVFADQRWLWDCLYRECSNVWVDRKPTDDDEIDRIVELGENYQTECLEELKDDIEFVLKESGVDLEEVEIAII